MTPSLAVLIGAVWLLVLLLVAAGIRDWLAEHQDDEPDDDDLDDTACPWERRLTIPRGELVINGRIQGTDGRWIPAYDEPVEDPELDELEK